MKKIIGIVFLFVLATACLSSQAYAAPNVEGIYKDIDNNCEDDGNSIKITQNGNNLTFSGGFDYAAGTYQGTIENDNVLVVFENGSANTSLASCSGNINTTIGVFQGACNVTGEQAEYCLFKYQKVKTQIAGVYNVIDNECEDDEGAITISQDGSSLEFLGGFTYGPATYTGVIKEDSGKIKFRVGTTNTQTASLATCEGYVTVTGEFSGFCNVTGYQAEFCNFKYQKSNFNRRFLWRRK